MKQKPNEWAWRLLKNNKVICKSKPFLNEIAARKNLSLIGEIIENAKIRTKKE